MGYVKITKGSSAPTAGEILIPADNVATVKVNSTPNVVVKYLGGFQLELDFSGNAEQDDAVELIKVLDLAAGISGSAIPVTLKNQADIVGTSVGVWV